MAFLSKLFRRPANFREEVEAHVRSLGDRRALEWQEDGNELSLHFVDRHLLAATTVELTESFREWKSSGDCSVAKASVAAVARPGATTEDGILPLIGFTFDDTPRLRRVAPGLRLELLWADESGEHALDDETLKAKGLTWDEALARATEREAELSILEDDEALFVSENASLVLASLGKLPLPTLAGEPVFIVFDHETLLLTGTREKSALGAAGRVIVENLEEAANDFLGLCFVYRSGALVPWLPPRSDAPLRTVFIAFRRAGLERAYAQQKKGLSDTWTSFVPTFTVERAQGMPLLSFASWGKGLKPLLPQADIVVFSRSFADHRPVAFELIRQRFPHLIERVQALWPPRYIATGFPSDDELASFPSTPAPDLLACVDVEEESVDVPLAQIVSREVFAKECLELLANLHPQGLEYIEDAFGVQYETDPPPGVSLGPGEKALSIISFGTPYERYAHLPDGERRDQTREFLSNMLSSMERIQAPAETNTIMPILQPVASSWRTPMQNALRLGVMGEVITPLMAVRTFVPGLQIAFVVDLPQSVQFLTAERGNSAAGSPNGLFELAVENLRRSTSKPLCEVRPGLYQSPLGDEYDATRLLLIEAFLELKLKGHPVAFVPNRNTLLVTGSDDDANLVECFARVRLASREDARPVTLMPLALTSDGWQPWLPKASSAARPSLAMLFKEALQDDFTHSAELLSQRFSEVEIARFGLKDGVDKPLVLAIVDQSKPTLLPKTDVVSSDGVTVESWSVFASRHPGRLFPLEETAGQWFRFSPE